MDTTTELHDLIVALRDREGWTEAELQRRSGVATTTLARIAEGRGGRADALAKLDAAFELPKGTLSQVKRGEVSPDEVLARLDQPNEPPPDPSLRFRVESLERTVTELREAITDLARAVAQRADEPPR